MISHKQGPEGVKYILKLKSTIAKNADGLVYSALYGELQDELITSAFNLGDHAFHGVLCPYSSQQIETSILQADRYKQFNRTHSESAEHGMRHLKSWGIVRGRSDHALFDKNEVWETALNSVWSLHNYFADGSPLINFLNNVLYSFL
jgi:hypothetical protein